MPDPATAYPHFRLNFEQQQKRAKDLLKAARAGDRDALIRFRSEPKLAEAQYLIAQELRFESWAALKRHIASMAQEREAIEPARGRGPDHELRTLHVRCGSDLKRPLELAGFGGDFYEHSYPYAAGPAHAAGPGCLEERARFLLTRYGRDGGIGDYDQVLAGLRREEQLLLDSAAYDRIVIWSERDCHDQLVLARLLGHFATHPRPPLLELINVGEFPGAVRFIGLGQLPPEALRLLWKTRKPVGPAELGLGREVWGALVSPDPRALAGIMRSGTPALPLLAPALHRHLRELPSVANGLSLTQELALTLLAQEPHSLNRIFTRLTYSADPLPGQGDLQLRDRLLDMELAREPVYTRQPGLDRDGRQHAPWTDVLTITDLGRAILRGTADFQALEPPARWVGGVQIGTGHREWRWDERLRDALPN